MKTRMLSQTLVLVWTLLLSCANDQPKVERPAGPCKWDDGLYLFTA